MAEGGRVWQTLPHYQTDSKLEEMENRLSAIYSRSEKEIGERWKEYLVESQSEIDELKKAYELAKKGGDKGETEALRYRQHIETAVQSLPDGEGLEVETLYPGYRQPGIQQPCRSGGDICGERSINGNI